MGGKTLELDSILEALKPVGRYQVVQTFFFFISYLSCSYSLFLIIFTGQKVGHSCAPSPNDTALFLAMNDAPWTNRSQVHYGKCTTDVISNVSGTVKREELSCTYGMHYDKPKDFSVASEFDLVCGRAPLLGLSQTLLMLGQGFGSVFFTALSDRYGRKRIQVTSHVLLTAFSVVIGFAPNYATFATFKLLGGAVQQGVVMTTVTANVESYPGRYRSLVAGAVGSMAWALITSSFVVWAYFLRGYSWRVLQLASTSVGAAVLLQLIILKEPMRWLLANGRTDEVLQQLERAAKVNKRDVRTVLELFRQKENLITDKGSADVIKSADTDPPDVTRPDSGDDIAAKAAGSEGAAPSVAEAANWRKTPLLTTEAVEPPRAERLSCLDLLRHRRLRFNALRLWAVWFINSLTYFALMLMSGSLTGDVYLSFFLNVIVEIPACFIFLASIERIGRRGTLMMFHCVAAASLLTSGVLISYKEQSSMKTAAMVTSLIGKLGISGSFNCVFFYTPEIFPTNIRNLAIGTGSTAARVGGMIAPFVGLLVDHVVWAPGVIFGTCNLLIIFVIRQLPDSMGRELPQTLNDLEAWYLEEPDKAVKDKKSKDTDCESGSYSTKDTELMDVNIKADDV